MWGLLVLTPKPRPLLHPKAVLFVDHHQTQMAENHRVFNQGMRTDQNLYAARTQGCIDFRALLLAGRTSQQSYIDPQDRKSTRLNSSHVRISYAVFCLKKKKKIHI